MSKPTTAYIGLGSNLGSRNRFIADALRMLGEHEGIEMLRVSDIRETQPLGQAEQPKYLNCVAELRTNLSAQQLHEALVETETVLGRQGKGTGAPRTIDLDMLLYGNDVVRLDRLTVPHPQMHLRSFVLAGLCQLDPNLMHPVLAEPISELRHRLGGQDFILRKDAPQVVSVAGLIGVGKTTLAGKLAEVLGCTLLLEPYDTNPFMPEVYAGRQDLALDSQLYFLTKRAEQLGSLAAGELAISDYVFEKELIYARRLLSPLQLELYERIYAPAAAQVVPAALVIYLRDSVQRCLERIHSRNRPYEQRIETRFLDALDADYEQLFASWAACPVIRVSTSDLDYADEGRVEHLARQIEHYVVAPRRATGKAGHTDQVRIGHGHHG